MKYVMFLQDLGLSRDETRELLRRAGCHAFEPVWSEDEPDEAIKNSVEIVVTSKHRVSAAELDEFPNARMVSMAFTGYNDVDIEYCNDRNLSLYYVPDYSTDSVAELAVAMAGSLLRRLPVAESRVASGRWDRAEPNNIDIIPGLQLRGRTVGIIGTGTIGLRTAEIFHYGFRCPLIAWSQNRKPEFRELGGTYLDTIDDVFSQADVVSLHLQLIEGDTSDTANAERIGLLREDSVLINTARTGLVDLEALMIALKERRILGAGLDITEEDHLREDLIGIDNLILTPHIGYRTDRALKKLAEKTIENIGRFLKHDPTNRLPSKPKS